MIQKRPLSPDVFELDGKHMHYKMPLGALSSIANRVTGVALSAGFAAAGYVALTGDLPGALAAFKANHPVLVYPIKVGLWLYWLLCLLLCGVSCGVSVCFPHALPCPQKTHTQKKTKKKAAVSFPIIYHFLGGCRHFVWDLHKIGNQADKSSLLETPKVEESSKYLAAAAAALTAVAMVL